jgi:NADH-quinone oxidoreductase subunit M
VVIPLVLVTIFYGVYPAPVLNASEASVQALVAKTQAAIGAAAKVAALVAN